MNKLLIFFISTLLFFAVLPYTIEKAYAVAATDVVPKLFYQAASKSYSWTVGVRTYTGNRNVFNFEKFACLPLYAKVEESYDTCIPTAISANGNKYWNETTPVRTGTCNEIQMVYDMPPATNDTRTNNGTGRPNYLNQVCSSVTDQRAPYPFLRVTGTFDYKSSLCSNGTNVVLAGRADPNSSECKIDISDMRDHPRNYSTSQYSCMVYFDDLIDVTACKGTQCKTITSFLNTGNTATEPVDVCSAFVYGDGTYNITMAAYDYRNGAYGTANMWLTAHPTYLISGNLFVDINRNGIKDSGEANYSGTSNITVPEGTLTQNANGTYSINNLTAGTIAVSLSSVPANYVLTGGSSFTVTLGSGCSTGGAPGASCSNDNVANLNFGIAPIQTISGNVFIDANKNGIKDAGEANYTGTITITSNAGSETTSAGTYTINNLSAGSVTVSYSSLPADYTLVYPLNGPPPSHVVTVGPSCNTNGARGATCSGGNITNLNFAISNLYPWIQSTCGSMRIDSGITNRLYAGKAALTTSASCTNPGVAFSGDSPYSFGQGQISSTNWIVGGTSYPEVYPASSPILSSYTQLDKKTVQGGITPTDLATICTTSNCTLPANLPHGVYKVNGNLALNAYTFPANQNYVFLINGWLTINGNIVVPSGSSALFAASNAITVERPVSRIEGVYTTDRSFIVQSYNNCIDVALTVAGSVIMNAGLTGGTLQNNRDLCGGNSSTPTISFVQRLDFLFSLPTFLRSRNTYSWEAAP